MKTLEVAAWWLVLAVFWLLTLTAVTPAEVALALVGAVPGAVATTAARRALGVRWRPRGRWAAWVAPLPGAILMDAVRVLLGRRLVTPVRTVPLVADASTADRAVAASLLSASPATVVVDVTERSIVLHAAVPAGSRLERAVGE